MRNLCCSFIPLIKLIDVKLASGSTFLDALFHVNKVGRRQRPGIDTIKYHTWPRTPHGKVTKRKKTSHTREPSWQVTTRLQGTYKTV